MIEGIAVEIARAAVVVRAEAPLRVVSSAVVGGGFARARAVINLHVAADAPCPDPAGLLAAFARRAGVPSPWVGLLTGASTEHATLGRESAPGVSALAVATVGLSNRMAAGRAPVAVAAPSTINTIVLVDADPEPAALVNAVMTATEVKVLALGDAGILGPDGGAVSGTSTDAVVVAATGRGRPMRFGGPASEMGAVIARAVRQALDAGIRGWRERNGA